MANIKRLFISIAICYMMIGCESYDDDSFEIFRIRKGEHYSEGRHLESLQLNVLKFVAKFDESAVYQFEDRAFQNSKNKLLGFSDCNSLHHQNSARFAWQWYNGRIEIFAYCYRNNDRIETFIGSTYPGETNRYTISITDKAYVFSFKGKEVSVERGQVCNIGIYEMLWPYFGGQMPAPHDVSIYIDRF